MKQILVMMVAVVLVVGCGEFVKGFKKGVNRQKKEIRERVSGFDVTVAPNSIHIEEGSSDVRYVRGNAQNVSSKTLEQVELHFELYDANGQMLGTSMDFTNKLGPSMTWTFRAACMFTNVATAKFTGVTYK